MSRKRSDIFRANWLKAFKLKSFDETKIVSVLETLPFSDERDFPLIKYLFTSLPQILDERRNEYVWNLANAYGYFCLNFWQARTSFVAFPETYAELLKTALESKADMFSPKIRAIVELTADTSSSGGCGFNSFEFKNLDALKEAQEIVCNGRYEDFLSDVGRAKYGEFEQKILSSSEFKRDWELIKSLYPNETNVTGKLRRRLLSERGWTLDNGVSFDTQQSEFEAVFELFCWKYYLWAMDGDKPYIMKPSVNITPLGTQIFIPSYISYDAKRDFNHGKISRLHKAKGTQKQGLAFSESRTRNDALKKLAISVEAEGRKNKLKGDKLLEYIASSIGRPNMDFRSIRKLLER